MKIKSIIKKGFREQIRSFWILILTVSMGPFFIGVYYLIIQSSKPDYKIFIENNDKGAFIKGNTVNLGDSLSCWYKNILASTPDIPFSVIEIKQKKTGLSLLKNKKTDVLIVIPENFSEIIYSYRSNSNEGQNAKVQFFGDLTSTNYMLGAIYANEALTDFCNTLSGQYRMVSVEETAIGSSGKISDFDMIVPGILILSLIMLMFTATLAFVVEVENKTIIRLKLSQLTSLQFLTGTGIVQLFVGILSILLTLVTALMLGFHYSGSLFILILIAAFTSLSIIAFSLIIAAFTKTANEVLVVGNFPMFLFMFFTGAAFPMKSQAWFTIADYPVNIQSLMSPTHAISALNKVFILDMGIKDIIPEIIGILVLTFLYFILGGIAFKRRHLNVIN